MTEDEILLDVVEMLRGWKAGEYELSDEQFAEMLIGDILVHSDECFVIEFQPTPLN